MNDEEAYESRYVGEGGIFTGLPDSNEESGQYKSDSKRFDFTPAKSIEGWILIVTNIHEEASEDSVLEKFETFGDVKGLHLNLDRRTGYVKGYALVEFVDRKSAEEAIEKLDNTLFLDQRINVSWAFMKVRRR